MVKNLGVLLNGFTNPISPILFILLRSGLCENTVIVFFELSFFVRATVSVPRQLARIVLTAVSYNVVHRLPTRFSPLVGPLRNP